MDIISIHSRRNIVAEAVRKKWPGNSIPTFRNNPANIAELDNLVAKLLKGVMVMTL